MSCLFWLIMYVTMFLLLSLFAGPRSKLLLLVLFPLLSRCAKKSEHWCNSKVTQL
uniref:Uncharacterized protein n=1 Tax=Rhizophora mucronata TaxID=61149 RepID=A0A2P2N210_RHIMU